MEARIEGSPGSQRRFLVLRDIDGSGVLASFDTLDEAIADVRRRRGDWRDIIMDFRTIVWPEDRVTRRGSKTYQPRRSNV
jgi:hypothetical protein